MLFLYGREDSDELFGWGKIEDVYLESWIYFAARGDELDWPHGYSVFSQTQNGILRLGDGNRSCCCSVSRGLTSYLAT